MNHRALLPAAGVRLAVAALTAAAFLGMSGVATAARPEAGAKRYLIQYSPGKGAALKARIASVGGSLAFDYARIDGLAADLSAGQLRAIRSSGLATLIEDDSVRTLHSHLPDFDTEFVPWGVDRIDADAVWSTSDVGEDPHVRPGAIAGQGVVVAVLDTGIDYGHPDLAANILDLRADGVVRDFLDGDADPTDSTQNGHGTSSASVIASVDNEVGVIGVAPKVRISPYRVCDGDCPLSAIIGGLLQAIDDGVDVINMSFGGGAGQNFEAAAIQAANRAGIVLIASAGNDSTQKVQFPAGYDTVIAVGATDSTDAPATFTNVGGWVDVTGPGVDVPAATCRGCGRDAFLDEVSPTARSFNPRAMEGTAVAGVVATPVSFVGFACTAGGALPDLTGTVALIERGECAFAEKVANAEAAGAVGTIVYNNAPGNFDGTLGDYESEGPSASLSQQEGQLLRADVEAGVTLVNLRVDPTDYDLVSGTSFSGPHVAGVAALVKSANPSLSSSAVRKIIESTAEPLGSKVVFGAGMVRADLAVEAALSQ
jgi:subtilisin family serine protease